MMTPWKKKKIRKLKQRQKELENKLIQYIGIDNNKYWSLWIKKETITDQIIKETGR